MANYNIPPLYDSGTSDLNSNAMPLPLLHNPYLDFILARQSTTPQVAYNNNPLGLSQHQLAYFQPSFGNPPGVLNPFLMMANRYNASRIIQHAAIGNLPLPLPNFPMMPFLYPGLPFPMPPMAATEALQNILPAAGRRRTSEESDLRTPSMPFLPEMQNRHYITSNMPPPLAPPLAPPFALPLPPTQVMPPARAPSPQPKKRTYREIDVEYLPDMKILSGETDTTAAQLHAINLELQQYFASPPHGPPQRGANKRQATSTIVETGTQGAKVPRRE